MPCDISVLRSLLELEIDGLSLVDFGDGSKLCRSLNGERYWIAFIDNQDG